jgi:hypothetical protein
MEEIVKPILYDIITVKSSQGHSPIHIDLGKIITQHNQTIKINDYLIL